MSLKVGDKAPEFTLPDHTGQDYVLSDHIGKSALVVYFYPKDDTPGCTAEACTFRDMYQDFSDLNAEVIGVSADSVGSHASFREKHRLTFTLCSDVDNAVRKAYGAHGMIIPGRKTYVIDLEGNIALVFNSQLNPKKHVSESIKIIKAMMEKNKEDSFVEKIPVIGANFGEIVVDNV